MITQQEFDVLMEKFLRARNVLEVATSNLEMFYRRNDEPVKPKAVLSVDEWNEFDEKRTDYYVREISLKADKEGAQNNYIQVSNEVIAALPQEVWFKYDIYAIGVGHTNWGGSKSYVRVRLWGSDLPSLDETYKGD